MTTTVLINLELPYDKYSDYHIIGIPDLPTLSHELLGITRLQVGKK